MSKVTRGIALIALGLALVAPIGAALEPAAHVSSYTAEEWRELHALSITGLWLLIGTGVYEVATCRYADFLVTQVKMVVGRGA